MKRMHVSCLTFDCFSPLHWLNAPVSSSVLHLDVQGALCRTRVWTFHDVLRVSDGSRLHELRLVFRTLQVGARVSQTVEQRLLCTRHHRGRSAAMCNWLLMQSSVYNVRTQEASCSYSLHFSDILSYFLDHTYLLSPRCAKWWLKLNHYLGASLRYTLAGVVPCANTQKNYMQNN